MTPTSSDWHTRISIHQVEHYIRKQAGEINFCVPLNAQELADEAALHFQAYDDGKTPQAFVEAAQRVVRYFTGE